MVSIPIVKYRNIEPYSELSARAGVEHLPELTSTLDNIISNAEARYGSRNKNYKILGIRYSGDNPRIHYPFNDYCVVVELSPSAINNLKQACFQLAHEAIHLLSPTGKNDATNLDEGLAELNSNQYMGQTFSEWNWHGDLNSYSIAKKAVVRLLRYDANCIYRLRQTEPTITLISESMLLRAVPELSQEDAFFLSSRFIRE